MSSRILRGNDLVWKEFTWFLLINSNIWLYPTEWYKEEIVLRKATRTLARPRKRKISYSAGWGYKKTTQDLVVIHSFSYLFCIVYAASIISDIWIVTYLFDMFKIDFLTNRVQDGLIKLPEWMVKLEIGKSRRTKCNYLIQYLASFWLHYLNLLFIQFLQSKYAI